jgi:hypothetical protein
MDAAEEIFLIDREYVSLTQCTNSGRTHFVFEKRHLSEYFIGPHGSKPKLPSVGLGDCLDLTSHDDEHAIAHLSLADNHLTVFVFFSQTGHSSGNTSAIWIACQRYFRPNGGCPRTDNYLDCASSEHFSCTDYILWKVSIESAPDWPQHYGLPISINPTPWN